MPGCIAWVDPGHSCGQIFPIISERSALPCRREWVWALKRDFPELEFSLNGVVQDCHEAAAALQHEEAGARLHGVMIGRAAYHGPWACLGNADRAVFGAASNAAANRREVGIVCI